MGGKSSATCTGVCNGIHCFLDAPVFAASATTHEAARASPIMAHHPLLPGNFRIIFHDNDVCDFSLNECTMGLVAYEMQQLKRLLMARDAKDERLTPGMRVFLSSRVPRLTILGATMQEIEERPAPEAGCNISSFNRKSFSSQLKSNANKCCTEHKRKIRKMCTKQNNGNDELAQTRRD